MIERYSRPQMKRVWSDENKFNKWLDVEIAVCDAWAEVGTIPRSAIPKIKLAKCNIRRMDEILQETRQAAHHLGHDILEGVLTRYRDGCLCQDPARPFDESDLCRASPDIYSRREVHFLLSMLRACRSE